jgi:phosphate-selective porin OprO/OprP
MYTVGGELAGNRKSFYLPGEYCIVNVNREQTTAAFSATNRNDENNFSGGYVQASWIVTGETRRYNVESASYGAPRPAQPFSFSSGGWGALELKARYSFISLNDGEGAPGTALANGAVRGGEERIVGAGFNWYPNNNVRFMVDFLNVHVDRLNAAGLQIGKTYNVLGIRTQFAF